MAVDSLWEISPLPVPSATAKTSAKTLSALMNIGFAEAPGFAGSLLTFRYI
jgi:hypothetical protein